MKRPVRGIFCHDLPILKDINGVYCSTTLTDDLFKRYFCAVDELVVATRVYPIKTTFQEVHQERISLPNVRIIDLPNINSFRNYLSKHVGVKEILTKELSAADLIFIRGGVIAMLSADIARKLKKPYLIECGGCAWESYWYHSLVGKLIAPYMEYRQRVDMRNAAYAIYVTEKWLQKRYPTDAKYTTYASNVILKGTEKQVLLNRLEKIKNKNDDVIVLGTTAAIDNKAKGQQYVIEALASLKPLYNIRYEMVGGGSSDYLMSIAQKYGVLDNVVFRGQLNHEEVLKWLDNLDLYIQPSRQEGLPRALIEAMSRACPAIGSRIAGIPELLQEEALFEAGNIKQLTKTIERMIDSDLVAYANKNFSKVTEYELDKLNERRTKIYTQYRKDMIGE